LLRWGLTNLFFAGADVPYLMTPREATHGGGGVRGL
jgi:hypothetical protein